MQQTKLTTKSSMFLSLILVCIALISCRQLINTESEERDISQRLPAALLEVVGPNLVMVDNTIQLTVNIEPVGVDQSVRWESVDSSRATVSSSGVVSGISVGPVDIVAKTLDGSNLMASHKVSVVDDKTTVTPEFNLALRAENFQMTLEEASGLTLESATTAAGVMAWALDEVGNAALSVDTAQLSAITDATEVGVYPLTFTATHSETSETITKTIMVTLADGNTVVDSAKNLVLQAISFQKPLTEASGLTTDTATTAATASAWTLDGVGTAALSVDTAQLAVITGATQAGGYPLTFTATHSDTSETITKTIVVSLTDDNTVVDSTKNLALQAVSFQKPLTEASGLTTESATTAATASAWTLDGVGTAALSVDTAQLAAITGATEVGAYPLTFTATHSETSETITKTIVVSLTDDNTVVDSTKNLAIRAVSFQKPLTEASGLTTDTATTAATASAWTLDGVGTAALSVDSTQLAAITGATEVGAYPLTFTATHSDTSETITKTIMVTLADGNTVVDSTKNLAIRAVSFQKTLTEGNALTTESATTAATASAWTLDGVGTAALSVDSTQLAAITGATQAGAYPLTFTATHSDTSETITKTIVVSLTDDNTVVDSTKNLAIRAVSFQKPLTEASGLTTDTATTAATASAWTLDGVGTATLSVDTAQLAAITGATEVGAYPLTFTATHSDTSETITKTIVVSLTDDNTVVDSTKNLAIRAVSFQKTLTEGNALTTESATTAAVASAWTLDGVGTAALSVDTAQLAAITGATQAGAYPLTFTATHSDTSETITKTIVVSLTDDNTVVDSTKNLAIRAVSFQKPLTEGNALTTESATTAAVASAWTLDGVGTAALSVDTAQLAAITGATEVGAYPLTFTATHSDTSETITKTVIVSLTDDNTVVDSTKNLAIRAVSFQKTLTEGNALTTESATTAAVASAWTLDGVGTATLSVDTAQLAAITGATEVGAYPLTFTATHSDTSETITKTIVVSLTDDNTVVDSTKNLAIRAVSFQKTLTEGNALTTESATTAATASAWTLDGVGTATLSVDSAQLAAITGATEVGGYPLTFTATHSETSETITKTIVVSLTDDNTVVDSAKNLALQAVSFQKTLTEGNALTTESATTAATASAWTLDGVGTAALSVDTAQLTAITGATIVGSYPLTFTATHSDTSEAITKTIMVTLTDSNTVVIEDYGIYGVDFTITTLDVANLTDAIVLDNASAIGWKLTDGSSVELSPTWTAVEAVPGVYTVTLALAHDPTKSKDIQVTVIKAPMTLIYTLPTAISNFTLPLEPTGTYDLLIDWGDGSDPEQITSGAAAKHTYAAAGTYKVTVGGNPTFTTISKGGAGGWGDPGSSNAPAFNSNNYLTAIESFGGVEFIDNINTFAYIQKNVTFPANTTDTPYIKGSVQKFFYRAKLFDQPLNHWNTTEVTSMSEMFYDAEAFNQDLNSWNVSSVTDMIRLFQNAKAFNGNISSWDVSKITSSLGMFWGAESFNQDISNWDVSSVTIMAHMFRDAVSFNQDLNNWDTSKNTTMYYMFYNAQAFNGNISSWDVSGVANMNSTFCFAGAFNQDIGSWDVSSVTAMAYLFYRCRIFNQDLSGWDVSSVTGRTGYDVDTDAWDPAYKPF